MYILFMQGAANAKLWTKVLSSQNFEFFSSDDEVDDTENTHIKGVASQQYTPFPAAMVDQFNSSAARIVQSNITARGYSSPTIPKSLPHQEFFDSLHSQECTHHIERTVDRQNSALNNTRYYNEYGFSDSPGRPRTPMSFSVDNDDDSSGGGDSEIEEASENVSNSANEDDTSRNSQVPDQSSMYDDFSDKSVKMDEDEINGGNIISHDFNDGSRDGNDDDADDELTAAIAIDRSCATAAPQIKAILHEYRRGTSPRSLDTSAQSLDSKGYKSAATEFEDEIEDREIDDREIDDRDIDGREIDGRDSEDRDSEGYDNDGSYEQFPCSGISSDRAHTVISPLTDEQDEDVHVIHVNNHLAQHPSYSSLQDGCEGYREKCGQFIHSGSQSVQGDMRVMIGT